MAILNTVGHDSVLNKVMGLISNFQKKKKKIISLNLFANEQN